MRACCRRLSTRTSRRKLASSAAASPGNAGRSTLIATSRPRQRPAAAHTLLWQHYLVMGRQSSDFTPHPIPRRTWCDWVCRLGFAERHVLHRTF